MTTAPFWVTAFLDVPAAEVGRGARFWQAVTGWPASAPGGERAEFRILLPPDGDDYLRLQGLGDGGSRVHLDLHVADPAVAAEAAVEAGARLLVRHEEGYLVLRSPGGFEFCLVPGRAERRPAASQWPGGRSRVDQVCLDVPPSAYDAEVAFWQAVTGWERGERSGEFERLDPAERQPLRWLLQRLEDEQPSVSAHLDLGADDHDAEVTRHLDLGATVVGRYPDWTVLGDPTGVTYCVTRRSPW